MSSSGIYFYIYCANYCFSFCTRTVTWRTKTEKVGSYRDKYFRDTVCDTNWQKNTVTFPDDKQWERKQKWLTTADPQGHDWDPVRYLIELKSFNMSVSNWIEEFWCTTLKKFSVVHSDRPKHTYLNPLSTLGSGLKRCGTVSQNWVPTILSYSRTIGTWSHWSSVYRDVSCQTDGLTHTVVKPPLFNI